MFKAGVRPDGVPPGGRAWQQLNNNPENSEILVHPFLGKGRPPFKDCHDTRHIQMVNPGFLKEPAFSFNGADFRKSAFVPFC